MEYIQSFEKDIEALEGKFYPKQQTSEEETSVESTEILETQSEVPVPEVVPEKKKEEVDWESRFKGYKSSTDSTIFKLRQENVSLSESNVSLSQKVDDLSKKVAEFLDTSFDPYEGLISDEERDIVGEDTLSIVKKTTKAAVTNATKKLEEELAEERRLRLAEAQQRSAELVNQNANDFRSRLEDLSPNYQKYDTDTGFHKYMTEPDTYSGIVRSTIFYNAKNIGDVGTVARFFNDYEKSLNASEESLEEHISPTNSNATAAPKPKQRQEVLSVAFISKFYDDCIAGKYKGKDKVRKEIENKIDEYLRKGAVK